MNAPETIVTVIEAKEHLPNEAQFSTHSPAFKLVPTLNYHEENQELIQLSNKNLNLSLINISKTPIEFNVISANLQKLHPEAPSENLSLFRMIPNRYFSKFYIFGGLLSNDRVNDLIEYNLISKSWRQIQYSQKKGTPAPRNSYAAALYKHPTNDDEDCLYIYGGYDGIALLDDLYCYHIKNNTWKALAKSKYPCSTHVACFYHDELVTFGGSVEYKSCSVNVYDIAKNSWTKYVPPVLNTSSNHFYENPNNHMVHPYPRYEPMAVMCGDNFVVIGGNFYSGSCSNTDCWFFHMPTKTWKEVQLKIPVPMTGVTTYKYDHLAVEMPYHSKIYVPTSKGILEFHIPNERFTKSLFLSPKGNQVNIPKGFEEVGILFASTTT